MKKYLAILMLALLAFIQARGEGMRFCEPDFDYPAKVEKNALALLAKAESMEAPQAGLARLRALIELCRAQRSIDPNSVYSQPAKVAALIDAPGNTDADRAMLMALQAKLYSGIYRRDRWNFDRVDAPLEPLPADVSEWSGEQFRSVIMDLYRRALDVKAVASTPVTVYSDVIEYSDEAPLYLPTVRDFILYQKYCFVRDTNFSERWKKAALADVFAEALDGCKENSDPFFFWNVAKIRVSSSDSDDLFSFYQPYSGIEAARYALAAAVANCYSSIRTIEDDRPMVEAIRESLR
ncbi:MAG: hypothetical protein K2F63_02155, partial [Muribaculaceae bacterium]|nr:hypothetical protein [Muribaculaceae bacterium]